MLTIANSELLKDKDIIEEINKFKWLESEKAGHDIGFEKASQEWISSCSKQYLAQRPGKSTGLWIKSQPFYSALNKEIKMS